jgi:hypothetical protein
MSERAVMKNPRGMASEQFISASWFYKDETEKVKMHWFLYEYACKLFDQIKSSKNSALTKWKSQRSNKQLAEFCAYLAKRTKRNIHDKPVSNPEEDIITVDEFIHDYCHTNPEAEDDAITDICEAAWVELLESCSICPTRCIREMHARCELFDRMECDSCLS